MVGPKEDETERDAVERKAQMNDLLFFGFFFFWFIYKTCLTGNQYPLKII